MAKSKADPNDPRWMNLHTIDVPQGVWNVRYKVSDQQTAPDTRISTSETTLTELDAADPRVIHSTSERVLKKMRFPRWSWLPRFLWRFDFFGYDQWVSAPE